MVNPSALVYHIAERSRYESCAAEYTPASYAREGFIHCSRWAQLRPVASRLFAGRTDLIVLEIDPSRLDAQVRYEDLYESGECFPHVYGPVPSRAVVGTLEVTWGAPTLPHFTRRGVRPEPSRLELVRVTASHLGLLALLNHQLREDEGAGMELGRDELLERMQKWLDEGMEAWLATLPDASGEPTVVAYLLVDPRREPVYLKHLFVARGLRRCGIGRRAVELAMGRLGPRPIDVSALVGNDAAVRFWRSLGFNDRVITLRRDQDDLESPEGGARHEPGGDGGGLQEPGRSEEAPGVRALTEGVEAAERFVLDALRSFNDEVSPYHRAAREPGGSLPVAVMLEDSRGRWLGGVVGSVHWGWLDVDYLWIPESLRGAGYGRRLVIELERRAASLGAGRAQLSTFSFQARGFYERLGYRVVGELVDFPPGGAMYWMRKDGLTS